MMREPPLVLVVDDVPDNVDILQMRLESQGYEVITAGDGEAALAIVRDKLPDLVLLDIMMPKLDGIATVKQLKADAALPFIPVILVTARADAKDVIAGLKAGGPGGADGAGAGDAAHQGVAGYGAGAGAPSRRPGGRAGAVEPGSGRA